MTDPIDDNEITDTVTESMSTRRSSSRKTFTTTKTISTTTEAYRLFTSEHTTESTLRSSTSDKFMPTFEGDYETVDKHKVCHNLFFYY